jgi:hypothetical protein
MFIFSWRGLGFLAPITMVGPFILYYFVLKVTGGLQDHGFIYFGGFFVASVLGPLLTYVFGKSLNKNQIDHTFCEVRFEHWSLIQGMVVLLIIFSILIMTGMEKLDPNSLLLKAGMVIYGISLLSLPPGFKL